MSRDYQIYLIIYLGILYMIGFISNYRWREPDDILYLNKSQWQAIFALWLPTFIGGFIK